MCMTMAENWTSKMTMYIVDKQEEEGQGLVGYFVGVIDVYLEGQQDNDTHNVDEKDATHN